MTVYTPGDVLQVARTKLCKEFKDKNLHPVGSGNGKLWIKLYDDAQLNMYYADGCMHYKLVCPFGADPIIPKISEVLLHGKCPTPPTPQSLDVIVTPRFSYNLDEEQFKRAVDDTASHGKQILDLYFKYYKSKSEELRSCVLDTPTDADSQF